MKGKLVIFTLILVLLVLPVAAACARPAPAGPVTLKMLTAFPKGTVPNAPGDFFIDEVNRRGKGELTIDRKGGPEAVATYDQPEATVKGVVDVHFTPSNYYAGLMGAPHVLEISPLQADEQGPGTEIYNTMVDMYKEIGIRFLGETTGSTGVMESGNFYVFTNKKVARVEDLAGQKMRISPMAVQFAEATRIQAITMPLGEIYLGMERGTIDGFIMPFFAGFNEMGLPKVTKYVIDHGIYRGNYCIVMNMKSWERLSEKQQKLLLDVMKDTISWTRGYLDGQDKSQRDRAKAAKVEFIKLPEAEAKRYAKISQDALWALFKQKLSPDRYKKLRQLLKYE